MVIKDKVSLFFFGLFALVGTVFAVAAYMNWQSTQHIVRAGIQTTGVVVANRYNKDKQGRTTTAMAPVVQFITAEGKPVMYYSQTYITPASFAVGQTITLWYLPDDPQEATLDGADGWILPLVFSLFGVVFSLIGYPALIRALWQTLKT